jgi:hypothetical protein
MHLPIMFHDATIFLYHSYNALYSSTSCSVRVLGPDGIRVPRGTHVNISGIHQPRARQAIKAWACLQSMSTWIPSNLPTCKYSRRTFRMRWVVYFLYETLCKSWKVGFDHYLKWQSCLEREDTWRSSWKMSLECNEWWWEDLWCVLLFDVCIAVGSLDLSKWHLGMNLVLHPCVVEYAFEAEWNASAPGLPCTWWWRWGHLKPCILWQFVNYFKRVLHERQW